MTNQNIHFIANKLVKAFLKNKIISPIPTQFTKKNYSSSKIAKTL